MSSEPQHAAIPAQATSASTPDAAAARRIMWRRIAIYTAAVLVLTWNAWMYLWPWLHPRLFPVRLPDEVPIESVLSEFDANPAAAAKKYDNKRIVVAGKMVVEPAKPGTAGGGRIFLQVTDAQGENLEVPVEFFDIDDAGSVESEDRVSLSGLIKYEGPGKFRLVGAGEMPVPVR